MDDFGLIKWNMEWSGVCIILLGKYDRVMLIYFATSKISRALDSGCILKMVKSCNVMHERELK